MAIRIVPGYQQQLLNQVMIELAARQEQDELGAQAYQSDIADWGERHFFIPQTTEPIVIPMHQKAVLRYFFTRRENGHFPFQTICYCLAPETKVLRGDLRWVPVGSLKIGDPLIGFDEETPKGKGYNRKFRNAKVTATGRRVVPARRITFDDGTSITASLEHPWLSRMWSHNSFRTTNIGWRKTSELKIGDKLPKMLKTWEDDKTYDGGYLAAAFDGEGDLPKDVGCLNFSQKNNAMYAEVDRILTEQGIRHTAWPFGEDDVCGGIRVTTRAETIHVLGKYRPKRLLARTNLENQTMISFEDKEIVDIEECTSVVVTLETSTKTYLAEGFAVHNSTIKKSGKSTIAGLIARWFAETQGRYKEIMCIGNDLDQAKDRSYKEVMRSLEMTPGFNFTRSTLPGRWWVNKLTLRCVLTGSTIKAIAVDAKGEAGGQQAMTIWTELWGAEDVEAKRFWDEMQPIPTVPDSLRLVETYAGYDGESELLKGLYDKGQEGRQLTAGEVATLVCRPDVPGESFQDFVDCWHETKGDPDVYIPIWSNPQSGIGMYWDSGMVARRMPWQHMFQEGREDGLCADCKGTFKAHDIGITAEEYYRNAEAQGPPQAYRRLHLNEWVGAESQFVPMESWDACGQVHDIPQIRDGDRTMLVLAADAAVTGDCFGIVAVTRCPLDHDCVDVRALKKWDPKESGGVIDMQEAEDFLRQACKLYNVVQIAFDPYQLTNMMQRLQKDGVAWCEPFVQAGDRLKADSQLYDMVISRRLHHSNELPLREHIANANAKVQPTEDSKLRIVKKASGKKIDLAVALSMALARCMYLRIPTTKKIA